CSSSSAMASPIISSVTCSAEQGMLSPLRVLNTRQSCRKSIMSFLQFLDFLHELSGFLEPAIDARIPDIGDRIERSKTIHHALADLETRNFPLERTRNAIDDLLHEGLDMFETDGPFLTGLLHSRE